MKTYWMILAAAFCLLLAAAASSPAVAHHSTAMYNTEVSVTITGTVKRFEWTNPHAFIYLDVKDEATGNLVEWEVEMMSLNHLKSYGWTSKTVKPGDVISCTGSRAKSGAPAMFAARMKLADGRDIRA